MIPDETRPALRAVPPELRTRLEGRVETIAIAITTLEEAIDALLVERLGAVQVALLEQVRTQLPALEEALKSSEPFDALAELSGQVRARLAHLTDAVAHRLQRRPASLDAGLTAVLSVAPAVVSQPLLLSAEKQGTGALVPLLMSGGLVGLAALSQSPFVLVGAAAMALLGWRNSLDGGWTLTPRHLELSDRVIPLADLAGLSPNRRDLVLRLHSGEQLKITRDHQALFGALSLLRTPLFSELSPVAGAGLWVEAVDPVAGLNACLLWFETGVLLVPTDQREKIAAAVISSASLAPASLVHAALTRLERPQLEGLARQCASLGLRWIPNEELSLTGSTLHTGTLALSLPPGSERNRIGRGQQ